VSQDLTGVYSVLSLPSAYRFFVRLVGGERARAAFVREYLRPSAGSRILDIGCGAGDLLPFLPEGEYVGFDASPDYVQAAQARFSRRGTFLCQRVEEPSGLPPTSFDLAAAFGVLHHLEDDGARRLFETAGTLLKPGGRLVTLDGCWTNDQSRFARWIISRDRGKSVRTPMALRQLAAGTFDGVDIHVRHDLLRVPYTHVIMECKK
jgi:SAM-dependent methyltransferase